MAVIKDTVPTGHPYFRSKSVSYKTKEFVMDRNETIFDVETKARDWIASQAKKIKVHNAKWSSRARKRTGDETSIMYEKVCTICYQEL